MILIAHRGNINGPNELRENSPDYIEEALKQGFDVEIDLRWYKNKWYLGHDWGQYEIDFDFLEKHPGLWIHCKDYVTLLKISQEGYDLNFFFHQNDECVLTSQRFIWTFPGTLGFGGNTICVLPEINNTAIYGYVGICSDYIGKYSSD